MRFLSTRRSLPGSLNTRPWSWNRTVTTEAPAAVSSRQTWSRSSCICRTEKSDRSVSFTPAMTTAALGLSRNARGSCTRRTSASRAPETAWLR